MAEPTGLLFTCNASEKDLAAFFKMFVADGSGHQTIGHVVSRFLDRGDRDGDILIIHHDPAANRLFLAWILNHYSDEIFAEIWPVLELLAKTLPPNASGEGVLASILPRAFEHIAMSAGKITRTLCATVDPALLTSLSETLWSFAVKKEFLDAAQRPAMQTFQDGMEGLSGMA